MSDIILDNMRFQPQEVIGPNENGIKTVIDYYVNDKGQKIKRVTEIKVTKVVRHVKRSVFERRQLNKFGDCLGLPPGPEPNITYQSPEEIRLHFKCPSQIQIPTGSALFPLKRTVLTCRNCGKTGHWTASCPENKKDSDTDSVTSKSSGVYVPPSKRIGYKKHEKNHELTIRVSNLPNDIIEQDLQDLFGHIGRIDRLYLAKDKVTDKVRGFAFVTYFKKEHADEAIERLNGHGYANLILHVEQSQPRQEKED